MDKPIKQGSIIIIIVLLLPEFSFSSESYYLSQNHHDGNVFKFELTREYIWNLTEPCYNVSNDQNLTDYIDSITTMTNHVIDWVMDEMYKAILDNDQGRFQVVERKGFSAGCCAVRDLKLSKQIFSSLKYNCTEEDKQKIDRAIDHEFWELTHLSSDDCVQYLTDDCYNNGFKLHSTIIIFLIPLFTFI